MWLGTSFGRVEAWFLDGSNGAPTATLIFAHGNAELIDHQDAIVTGYRRLGVSVMLCEYRGYGRSTGRPSEDAIVRDHAEAFDRLAARPDRRDNGDPGREATERVPEFGWIHRRLPWPGKGLPNQGPPASQRARRGPGRRRA